MIQLKLVVGLTKWKMSFNPDPSKQAQKVIFSGKLNKYYHPPLAINNNNVPETDSEKHSQ